MENLIAKITNQDKNYFTKQEILDLIESVKPKKPIIVENNGVKVDLEEYTVTYNGIKKMLPRKVTELTYYFIVNQGRTLRRDELLDVIWGSDVIVGDRTIDVHIRMIRKNFYYDCIETVKGVGYKWK